MQAFRCSAVGNDVDDGAAMKYEPNVQHVKICQDVLLHNF
ncbi:unnamed protein product [Larinioides sclopetarius]|uniref:Uncharacterized protein n=1 Tax=Larinioides sclopetarius TaxID=280406 RepID=A0AAV1ZI80_9ARAC